MKQVFLALALLGMVGTAAASGWGNPPTPPPFQGQSGGDVDVTSRNNNDNTNRNNNDNSNSSSNTNRNVNDNSNRNSNIQGQGQLQGQKQGQLQGQGQGQSSEVTNEVTVEGDVYEEVTNSVPSSYAGKCAGGVAAQAKDWGLSVATTNVFCYHLQMADVYSKEAVYSWKAGRKAEAHAMVEKRRIHVAAADEIATKLHSSSLRAEKSSNFFKTILPVLLILAVL